MVTPEESKWLKRHIPGHTVKDFMDDFEAKFGHRLKKWELGNFKTKTGIRSGVRYVHPVQGWNRGLHPGSRGRSVETQFKKGQVPHNHKKVGSSRVNVDGYIEVKVKEPNTWRLKQRVVWEKHWGAIPKDCMITFLDGDKLNCRIRNLALISKADNILLNNYKLRGGDPDTSKAAINTVKLIQKIKKVSQ